MTKRKGELSDRMIDAGWPHQVAIPAELLLGAGYFTVHLYCEGLSVCPRHQRLRWKDREHIVFCFADAEHADRFRARFNGEPMTPKQRRALDDRRAFSNRATRQWRT